MSDTIWWFNPLEKYPEYSWVVIVCWCLGSLRRAISNQGIDIVIPEYSGFIQVCNYAHTQILRLLIQILGLVVSKKKYQMNVFAQMVGLCEKCVAEAIFGKIWWNSRERVFLFMLYKSR